MKKMKKNYITSIAFIIAFVISFTMTAQTDVNAEKQVVVEESKITAIKSLTCSKTGNTCDSNCKNKEKGTCCKGKEKTSCSKSKKSSCSKSNEGDFNFDKANNYSEKKSSCSKKVKKGCCKKKTQTNESTSSK